MHPGAVMEIEVIDIDWEGPFPISYDRDEGSYGTDHIPSELLDYSGFYQVYGRHPVYGSNVLLYIGETKPKQDGSRSFRARMKEHLGGRFFYHLNLSVYIGPSTYGADVIRKVESILIFSHFPALNRKHIDGPVDGAEKYMVRNWGFLGSLESVCTGYWKDEQSDD
jgi:hypothetical protein